MRNLKLREGGHLVSTDWGKPSLPPEPLPFCPKFSRNPRAQSSSEHPAQLLCRGFLGCRVSLEKEPVRGSPWRSSHSHVQCDSLGLSTLGPGQSSSQACRSDLLPSLPKGHKF